MPASRLSEEQRAEMVEKFRQGVATVVLANTYDCSPNTVSRLVKAAMDGAEYERLKRQRQRRGGGSDDAGADVDELLPPSPRLEPQGTDPILDLEPSPGDPQPDSPPERLQQPGLPGLLENSDPPLAQTSEQPEAAQRPLLSVSVNETSAQTTIAAVVEPDAPPPVALEPAQAEEPSVLAIEDADDFGDDDDLSEDDQEFGDESLTLDAVFMPVPLLQIGFEATTTGPLAWGSAALPSSAYMLVEKTVELQPQVLRELPELGQLPEDEQERQALVLYVNPRQAKRQCGRNQRVIRIPDIQVFELTAPKLLAQGITRVVVEGSLFALPGS
ncbi:MAG: hypothetical protein VKI42_10005 [Synechococcaceae cyanobacterium]|nr:hypothetical protein [Synechococcaceae cyanobacterium]